ncbi:MAG: prolipoprotein diacylglyceryl transferase [bacterium]|nr:prolipoprotein diacylglyceryl transferase [bacterium]
MYPVLFKIGPMVIYTYGFAITIATIVASFLIWRRAKKLGFNEEHVIDMVLFSLFVALVFARTSYVLNHIGEFGNEILKILLITYFPGLDGIAGLAGGLLGFLLFASLRRWRLRPIFDCIVKGLTLGMSIVMMGAFFAGSYVGTPSTAPWAVVLPGFAELRHPVALYYSLYSFIMFVILVVLDRVRKSDGFLTSVFFILMGISLFVFEFFTEGGLVFFRIHLTQFFGIVSIICGIVLMIKTRKDHYVTA